jgi:hypothetical protein
MFVLVSSWQHQCMFVLVSSWQHQCMFVLVSKLAASVHVCACV